VTSPFRELPSAWSEKSSARKNQPPGHCHDAFRAVHDDLYICPWSARRNARADCLSRINFGRSSQDCQMTICSRHDRRYRTQWHPTAAMSMGPTENCLALAFSVSARRYPHRPWHPCGAADENGFRGSKMKMPVAKSRAGTKLAPRLKTVGRLPHETCRLREGSHADRINFDTAYLPSAEERAG
jgi:hypothetical protein